jgi:Flp pilus assembly protein TadG
MMIHGGRKKVNMDRKRNQQRPERGQSLMEFSVGMVILIILLAGAVDAGRALFTYMAMRDAAQEGALYGSTNPTDDTGIYSRVHNSSDMMEGLSGSINISKQIIGTACSGNGIKISVSYNTFPITMPFLGAAIGSQTVKISASATNTILTPKCH